QDHREGGARVQSTGQEGYGASGFHGSTKRRRGIKTTVLGRVVSGSGGLEPPSETAEVPVEALPECGTAPDRLAGVAGGEFDEVHRSRKVLHRHELRREAVPGAHVVIVPEWDRDPGRAVSVEAERGRLACPAAHQCPLDGLRDG